MTRLAIVLSLLLGATVHGQEFDDRPLTRGSFQRAAAVALPSVVQITVRATASFDPGTHAQEGGGGTGSGIIITRTGYIVTNRHVVDAALIDLKVRLSDGREFLASFVDKATDTDIALIRINEPPDDLIPATLRDTQDLLPGELVIAIGAPMGLRNTITQGVVSATRLANENPLPHPVIQTDADINPGNSGGPLIDLDGRVVGMNTFISSRTGNSIGLGFSIPAGILETVSRQMVAKQTAPNAAPSGGNGWIGVSVQDLDADLRRAFGIPADAACVLVTGTKSGSPARSAGLRQGDCIAGYNGTMALIEIAADFLWDIRNMSPGTPLTLSIISRGSTGRMVDLEVAAQP